MAFNSLEVTSQASPTDSVRGYANYSQSSNVVASNIVVRNTFIHVESDDEDENGKLPFSKMRTEPAFWCGTRGLKSLDAGEGTSAAISGLPNAGTKAEASFPLADSEEDVSAATSELLNAASESDNSPHSSSPLSPGSVNERFRSFCAPTRLKLTSDAFSTDVRYSSARSFTCGKSDLNVVVRNTFIDVACDEDFSENPSFEKVKSEPVRLTASINSLLLEDETDVGDSGESVRSFSRASTKDSLSNDYEEVVERMEGTHAQCVLQGNPHAITSPSECRVASKSVDTENPQNVAVPEADRQPEYSAGSALHGTGQCKPCAWFWRPQGCFNSSECQHCHMCGRGELKKMKKANVQLFKKTGKQPTKSRSAFQQRQAQAVASDAGTTAAVAGTACFTPIFCVMVPSSSMDQC